MRERPILMSSQMVCAILEGRKTQTVLKCRHAVQEGRRQNCLRSSLLPAQCREGEEANAQSLQEETENHPCASVGVVAQAPCQECGAGASSILGFAKRDCRRLRRKVRMLWGTRDCISRAGSFQRRWCRTSEEDRTWLQSLLCVAEEARVPA